MNKLLLASVLGLALSFGAHAQTAQQTKMKTCNQGRPWGG